MEPCRQSGWHAPTCPYLFHDLDGFHAMLGWWIQQHAVVEGLEHRLHGVHRPHQPNQLSREVIDGASHWPAEGGRGAGAAGAPAVVRNSRGGGVRVNACAGAAAVSRGDGFVMNGIPQDDDESGAEVLPGRKNKFHWEPRNKMCMPPRGLHRCHRSAQ